MNFTSPQMAGALQYAAARRLESLSRLLDGAVMIGAAERLMLAPELPGARLFFWISEKLQL